MQEGNVKKAGNCLKKYCAYESMVQDHEHWNVSNSRDLLLDLGLLSRAKNSCARISLIDYLAI